LASANGNRLAPTAERLGLPVKVGDALTLNRIGQRFAQPLNSNR